MSRQDKATTDRNAKTLRELIKRPENKVCADCKRNDPRWASWNLGVFVCIRCSGIHRSMGTHISKVKSVDLDMWTPDQMKNVQMWGNTRANLYWEAHLKPGHIPAEHKIESFIRSKYELKRWAMEGSPPPDPSVLDTVGEIEDTGEDEPVSAVVPQPTSSRQPASVPPSTSARQRTVQHTLLSTSASSQSSRTLPISLISPPLAVPAVSSTAASDLFSLDFTSPAVNTPSESHVPKKDVKNDILSLFGSSNSTPVASSAATIPQASPTSFLGQSGTGMWGTQSGWVAPTNAAPSSDPWGSFSSAAPAQQGVGFSGGTAQPNTSVWGAPQQQQNAYITGNVWGTPASSVPAENVASGVSGGFGDVLGGGSATSTAPPNKDDAFGDLWGGFK